MSIELCGKESLPCSEESENMWPQWPPKQDQFQAFPTPPHPQSKLCPSSESLNPHGTVWFASFGVLLPAFGVQVLKIIQKKQYRNIEMYKVKNKYSLGPRGLLVFLLGDFFIFLSLQFVF